MPLLGKKILVAEDDFLIAADVADAIAGARGIVVRTVPTVRAALEAIASESYDGAVLDVKLLDGSADAIARSLKAAATPYVLVTGYERECLGPDLADAPYIAKPFARADFLRLVDRHFR